MQPPGVTFSMKYGQALLLHTHVTGAGGVLGDKPIMFACSPSSGLYEPVSQGTIGQGTPSPSQTMRMEGGMEGGGTEGEGGLEGKDGRLDG